MASSNSSAAGGAPATDGFLPHCSPRVFTSPELFAPGEYEAASQEAHRALGFFLLAVLGCWSGLVLEVHPAWTLRRAYLASAATEAAASLAPAPDGAAGAESLRAKRAGPGRRRSNAGRTASRGDVDLSGVK